MIWPVEALVYSACDGLSGFQEDDANRKDGTFLTDARGADSTDSMFPRPLEVPSVLFLRRW